MLDQLLVCRERESYDLHAFVIMPDHFHALLTPGAQSSLEKAIQMVKGGALFRIKRELRYYWPVWRGSFHDRWMRDAQESAIRRRYIEENPVSARLVTGVRDYGLSSACGKFLMDISKV